MKMWNPQKNGILMTIVHCHIWLRGTLCGSSDSQGTTCSTTSTVSGKRGLHGRGRMMIHWSQPQQRPAASSCQLRCTSRMKIKEMLLCWPLASLPPSHSCHSCHSCEDLKLGALGFNITQKLSRSVGWTEWKWAFIRFQRPLPVSFFLGIFLQRICRSESLPDFGGATALQSQWSQGHWHGHHGGPRPGTGNRPSTSVFVKHPSGPGVCHCQFLPFPFELAIMAYDKNRFDHVRSFPRASYTVIH